SIAGNANTMNDINVAGKLLGDVGGSFVVNTAISGAAYKLGGMGAERYLTNLPKPGGLAAVETGPTPNVPPPADGGFWTRTVQPRLPMAWGVTTASTSAMMFEPKLAGIERFNASEPTAIQGDFTGVCDEKTQLAITVQLKSKAS